MICSLCNKDSDTVVGGLCPRCIRKTKTINGRLDDVKQASDFKEWDSRDLSEAFWIHFIEYQKRPNLKSLKIMLRAIAWAAHADHGLSNAFNHAIRWSGLVLYREEQREDLPEE